MSAPDDKDKKERADEASADPIAAATAVGMAIASQAVSMWFGVVSGLARAGQDLMERQKPSSQEPTGFEPGMKSAAESVQAAARTVAAEFERTARTVAESSMKMSNNAVAEAKSVVAEVESAPKSEEATDGVSASKVESAPKLEPVTMSSEPVAPAPSKAPSAPKPKAQPKPKAAKADVPKATPSKAAVSGLANGSTAPARIEKPGSPDDLKQLPGSGPKLEQVLNSLGVWTYAQVAAWTPEEIAYVEDLTGLNGRISADGWLAKAAELAKAGKS